VGLPDLQPHAVDRSVSAEEVKRQRGLETERAWNRASAPDTAPARGQTAYRAHFAAAALCSCVRPHIPREPSENRFRSRFRARCGAIAPESIPCTASQPRWGSFTCRLVAVPDSGPPGCSPDMRCGRSAP
jgi:hypothetical protein